MKYKENDTLNTYIITFKTQEKVDKKLRNQDILKNILGNDFYEVDVASMTKMPRIRPNKRPLFYIDDDSLSVIITMLTNKEVDELKNDPNISRIELDAKGYIHNYNLYETHSNEIIPWGIDRIKAPVSWEVTRGKGIKIGILDTGIDYNHEDLRERYRGGISFVLSETDPMDYNDHGTHVAGIVSSSINDKGVIGVAPSASLYSVKVGDCKGEVSAASAILGIYWCITNEINVINMSFGYPYLDEVPKCLEETCNYAWESGLILVASAGNTFFGGDYVNAPATYESVIAVSAVDESNNLADFSCRGKEVELSAPGDNIPSTLRNNRYGNMSGTSMAAPHVTGTVALALSSHRWSPDDMTINIHIRRLLAHMAQKLGNNNRNEYYGYGLVNSEASSYSFDIPPPIDGIP